MITGNYNQLLYANKNPEYKKTIHTKLTARRKLTQNDQNETRFLSFIRNINSKWIKDLLYKTMIV